MRPGFNLEYNQQHKLNKSLISGIPLFDSGRGNLSYYKERFRSASLMHTTRVSEATGHTSCVCMYTCVCTCVCVCACWSRYHYPSLHLLRYFKSLHGGPQQGQGTISKVGSLATSCLESLLKPVHLKFTWHLGAHSSLNSWPREISFPLVSKHVVGTNNFHTSPHCRGIRSGETFPPGLDVFIQMPHSENSPAYCAKTQHWLSRLGTSTIWHLPPLPSKEKLKCYVTIWFCSPQDYTHSIKGLEGW